MIRDADRIPKEAYNKSYVNDAKFIDLSIDGKFGYGYLCVATLV